MVLLQCLYNYEHVLLELQFDKCVDETTFAIFRDERESYVSQFCICILFYVLNNLCVQMDSRNAAIECLNFKK